MLCKLYDFLVRFVLNHENSGYYTSNMRCVAWEKPFVMLTYDEFRGTGNEYLTLSLFGRHIWTYGFRGHAEVINEWF